MKLHISRTNKSNILVDENKIYNIFNGVKSLSWLARTTDSSFFSKISTQYIRQKQIFNGNPGPKYSVFSFISHVLNFKYYSNREFKSQIEYRISIHICLIHGKQFLVIMKMLHFFLDKVMNFFVYPRKI